MRKLWAIVRFVGRWLGPVLLALAALLFVYPPMPFGDAASTIALLGAIVSLIAWLFARRWGRRRNRRILAAVTLIGLTYFAWSYWNERRGYTQETVSFDNRGALLVGTLYLPDHRGKVPGMVFLPGSGGLPRHFYRNYATHFAQAGYAVLLYDKRGVGESSGTREGKGILGGHKDLGLLASDAAAALTLLASRPEVRSEMLGIGGVSEGGLIAPQAAVLNGHTAFMLNLTSLTTTLFEGMQFQNASHNGSEQQLAEAERWFGKDYDPMPSLRTLNIPGLWLMADGDTMVPNGASLRNLKSLRNIGKPYQYRIIPGAWHGLVFGPKALVLDTIDTWLAQVTASR